MGLSWVVLLEVLLGLLQPPQSAQQHAPLHHRAGIGLRGHVSQVILHKHSDGKSPLICTPNDTLSHNSAVHDTRTKRVTHLSLTFSRIFTCLCEGSLCRQQKKAHREESSCSSCHPVQCTLPIRCPLSTYSVPNPHL